jgi:hypothetical protein
MPVRTFNVYSEDNSEGNICSKKALSCAFFGFFLVVSEWRHTCNPLRLKGCFGSSLFFYSCLRKILIRWCVCMHGARSAEESGFKNDPPYPLWYQPVTDTQPQPLYLYEGTALTRGGEGNEYCVSHSTVYYTVTIGCGNVS